MVARLQGCQGLVRPWLRAGLTAAAAARVVTTPTRLPTPCPAPQLRGLISDYQGGDEGAYARAFESFDMLARCLEEQEAPAGPEGGLPPATAAVAGTTGPAALAPPAPAAAAPVTRPPADEAPLISFD